MIRQGHKPVQARRVGHGIAVDHLGQRLAEQQLFNRQFLLFARQGARNFQHLKNLVGHEARAEGGFDRVVQLRLDASIQHQASFEHHKQQHAAGPAQVFQVNHQRIEHLVQRLNRAVQLAGAHAQAVAVQRRVGAAINHAATVQAGVDFQPVAMAPDRARCWVGVAATGPAAVTGRVHVKVAGQVARATVVAP